MHTACPMEDRMDLTRKENCSVLTPSARNHLLGCCIRTPLSKETYLVGVFQGMSSHLKRHKCLPRLHSPKGSSS